MQARVEAEFAHQAANMAAAPAFREPSVLERTLRAVGDARPGRVLDLACGPGIIAEAVAPHVGEVVGLDATPGMIRLAKKRLAGAGHKNGTFVLATAESLPFASGQFEQVLARLALHHFQDVKSVLAEVRRVLRAGGKLIVADVISSSDESDSRLHNSLEQLRDPTHVRMFPMEELLEMIGSSGFSIVHRESWQQERSFREWAAIVDDGRRTAPLEHVMRALVRAGEDAGIGLREEAGELLFRHTWMQVVAESD